jgi:hypothetical protein
MLSGWNCKTTTLSNPTSAWMKRRLLTRMKSLPINIKILSNLASNRHSKRKTTSPSSRLLKGPPDYGPFLPVWKYSTQHLRAHNRSFTFSFLLCITLAKYLLLTYSSTLLFSSQTSLHSRFIWTNSSAGLGLVCKMVISNYQVWQSWCLKCVYDTKLPSSNKSDKAFHNRIYPKPKRHRNAYMPLLVSNPAPSLDPFSKSLSVQNVQIFHDAIYTLDSPSCSLQL